MAGEPVENRHSVDLRDRFVGYGMAILSGSAKFRGSDAAAAA